MFNFALRLWFPWRGRDMTKRVNIDDSSRRAGVANGVDAFDGGLGQPDFQVPTPALAVRRKQFHFSRRPGEERGFVDWREIQGTRGLRGDIFRYGVGIIREPPGKIR